MVGGLGVAGWLDPDFGGFDDDAAAGENVVDLGPSGAMAFPEMEGAAVFHGGVEGLVVVDQGGLPRWHGSAGEGDGLADQVVSTVSIGSVVASSLEKDPADMPEYKALSDEEFEKIALRYNRERDVYGFITVLSLTKRQA
jgi:hypothetical protein